MFRNNLLGALLAIVLACSSYGYADAADDVVGVWSVQERTRGGLGDQLVFAQAGEVTNMFGALVDFKYEVDGTRIRTTSGEPGKTEQAVEEFSIDGNTLNTTQSDGTKKSLTRVGTAYRDVSPLVGEWSFATDAGQKLTLRYARNGTGQLGVAFQTRKGSYRLDDASGSIEFAGASAATFKLRREGAVLVTTDANGKERKFAKFEF